MPNTKTIYQPHWKRGATVYVILLQKSTGYLLNDATGAYSSGPADPYVALSEHATMKGMYSLAESRAAWSDGDYVWQAYEKTGASEAPTTDPVIGSGYVSVRDDQIVTNGTLDDWMDAARSFPKNTAFANFKFPMVDANGAAATGLTVTAQRSIDGAAYAACANAVSEVGNGTYKINLAAADLNGDVIMLKFTAATARQVNYAIITEATA